MNRPEPQTETIYKAVPGISSTAITRYFIEKVDAEMFAYYMKHQHDEPYRIEPMSLTDLIDQHSHEIGALKQILHTLSEAVEDIRQQHPTAQIDEAAAYILDNPRRAIDEAAKGILYQEPLAFFKNRIDDA